MKVFVSLNEFHDKRDGMTVSVVLFTLQHDQFGKYDINSSVNDTVRKELERYSYFSMYPDCIEDYEALKRNPDKQKLRVKIDSYLPGHLKKLLEIFDNKKRFVFYEQYHINTL